MAEASTTEPRAAISTTLILALASIATALVAMFGENDALSAATAVGALAGLVPWALVAGGVDLRLEVFAVLSFVPAFVVVTVGDSAGGMFPLMLLVVWVTLRSRRRWLEVVVIAASAATIGILAIREKSAHEAGLVYFLGGLGISWLTGTMLRRQEALTTQVRGMRDVEVQRLAADERAHIAREVHDVVAHSLTVVMLNLTGARRALATDPARADEALARAEVVGRDSLDSIRQVMDLLREPAAADALPCPTMDGIPRLVDGYRRAGLDVVLHVTGEFEIIDPTVELVAYRVVQESLANVLQHAPGTAATVGLSAGRDGLAVTIGNDAPTTPPPRSARTGLGTRGMSERVRAVGGSFDAGPTDDGGWLVSARLPARTVQDELAADRAGDTTAVRD